MGLVIKTIFLHLMTVAMVLLGDVICYTLVETDPITLWWLMLRLKPSLIDVQDAIWGLSLRPFSCIL